MFLSKKTIHNNINSFNWYFQIIKKLSHAGNKIIFLNKYNFVW